MGVPVSLTMPPVSGPHSVGCTDVMVGVGKEGSFFRLYYPCGASRDPQHPLWFPSQEYIAGFVSSLGWETKAAQYGASMIFGRTQTTASWNGPFLNEKDRIPLIIFSHGFGAFRTVYSSLCSELASQGFLVAAVEHRDGSACVTYHITQNPAHVNPQVIWVPFRKNEPGSKEFYLRNYQLHQRATECVRAVRVLEDIDAGILQSNIAESDFDLKTLKGRIDLSRVAVMGHSFGGSSALLSLTKDDIFRCAVALDAWMFPLEKSAYPNIQKPTLFINNEKFQTTSSIQQMRILVSGQEDSKILTVLGSVHESPTDFAFLTGYLANKIIGSRGTIDPHTCLDATITSTLNFLHKQLDLSGAIPMLNKLNEISAHIVADVPASKL
ncbi:platelet-activating factor acetylhydrolase 2, cytoplasmic [Pelodytes ibericus]